MTDTRPRRPVDAASTRLASATAFLPHPLPPCENARIALFAMRRMGAHGLADARAAHALFTAFGQGFRRPLRAVAGADGGPGGARRRDDRDRALLLRADDPGRGGDARRSSRRVETAPEQPQLPDGRPARRPPRRRRPRQRRRRRRRLRRRGPPDHALDRVTGARVALALDARAADRAVDQPGPAHPPEQHDARQREHASSAGRSST